MRASAGRARLGAAFDRVRSHGETALIAYMTGGFPSLDESLDRVEEIVAGGADVVEIGVPFSDPVADGPAIQFASHAALKRGVTLEAVLDGLAGRRYGVPVVLMSYLNPLLVLGVSRLPDRLAEVGVSGLIVPDLPAEESGEWGAPLADAGVDLVLLASPTSGAERLKQIVSASRGFVYYVSVTGTTGVRSALSDGLVEAVRELKRSTELPVAVGFGISSAAHVRRLRGVADGVVVGSRIIEAVRTGEDVGGLVRELKEATREQVQC